MNATPPPVLLDELAAAHAAEIAALASLVLQHRESAEQVVIDTVAEGARDPARPPAGPERRRFMLRIARRRVLAAQRRSTAVDPLLMPELGQATAAHGGWDGGRIEPSALVAAMAELPASARALITLRYALGLPDDELAAIAGGRPDRVARQVADALERLRERLDGGTIGAIGTIEEIEHVG